MPKPALDALMVLGIVGLLMFAGWTVRGWYEGNKALAAAEAAAAEREAFVSRESKVAAKVEEQLEKLRANERVIERERIKIVDRPVYRTDCIDDDGLQLIQRMARRGDPAQPAEPVPGPAP